jgi:hypothetical protein
MDDVENVTLLAPVRERLDKRFVEVVWEPQGRALSAKGTAYIAARWAHYTAEARAQGWTLFDGPITQLLEVRVENWPHIVLRLGPSDYKSFVVTRLRDRAWFEAHVPQDKALALGNSALLTHGQESLLGLRSHRVTAYPRRLHMFGGVVEALGTDKFPASTQGLLAHLQMELEEETGLTLPELDGSGPHLLSIAHDDFLGQPEMVWQWETLVSLKQIAARLDAHEHAGYRIVHRGDMPDELWRQMTPMAKQAWQVWNGA